jgi:cytochrome c-type biogenesis protein CcmE
MKSIILAIVTGAVVIGGVAFLALDSAGDVQYYVHVDDLLAKPEPWLSHQTIQVHGFARDVPLKGEVVEQRVRRVFKLENKGKTIQVIHEGSVPDTFKEEAETVAKGKLTRQGDLYVLTTVGGEAGIMAKCPSRYEGKK